MCPSPQTLERMRKLHQESSRRAVQARGVVRAASVAPEWVMLQHQWVSHAPRSGWRHPEFVARNVVSSAKGVVRCVVRLAVCRRQQHNAFVSLGQVSALPGKVGMEHFTQGSVHVPATIVNVPLGVGAARMAVVQSPLNRRSNSSVEGTHNGGARLFASPTIAAPLCAPHLRR